ncbi:MAG: hypothetical protein HXY26_01065 [Hydrogenophilaceae bacterium]|nr:hypothetical protein [Hydrogenophilaceae bacterium]
MSNDGTIQTDPMIGKVEDNYKSNEQPDATKNIGGAGLVGLLVHSYGDGGQYGADSHLAEFHGKSDLFVDATNKIGGAVLEDGTTVEIKADLAQEGRIDSNGSSVLFWGTWTNGSITVTEPERPSETDTLSPTQAVHFIGGAPFSDLPTSGGVVTYTHAAHTPASFSDGNGSGDMLSTSQVQIKFGTGQVHATLDIELTRANNTNVYQLAVPFADGHINVATGGITGKGSATFISGGADSAILECGSGCNGDIAGFVAGPNGKFVGLGWGIDGNTATPRQVTGVAAFVEQGSTGTLYTGTGAITGGGTSPVP